MLEEGEIKSRCGMCVHNVIVWSGKAYISILNLLFFNFLKMKRGFQNGIQIWILKISFLILSFSFLFLGPVRRVMCLGGKEGCLLRMNERWRDSILIVFIILNVCQSPWCGALSFQLLYLYFFFYTSFYPSLSFQSFHKFSDSTLLTINCIKLNNTILNNSHLFMHNTGIIL